MNRKLFAALALAVLIVGAAAINYVSRTDKYIVSYEIMCYDAESDYWYIHDANCNRAVQATSEDDMIFQLYDIESGLNKGFVIDSINVKEYVIVK